MFSHFKSSSCDDLKLYIIYAVAKNSSTAECQQDFYAYSTRKTFTTFILLSSPMQLEERVFGLEVTKTNSLHLNHLLTLATP